MNVRFRSDYPRKPLRKLCALISSGGTPSRKQSHFFAERGAGIRWVKSKELLDVGIDCTEEDISQHGLDNSSAKIYPKHTVLLAMYGANVGQLGWLQREASINQAVCGMVVNEEIAHYRFVFYSLLCCRGELTVQARGAAQQNLNQDIIRGFEIPCPNLRTQHKIASILSAYDDLIEKNTRRIAILEEMAQSLYREWFVEFRFPDYEMARFIDSSLGKIPDGWDRKPLDHLADLRLGKMLDAKKNKGDLMPYLANVNVRWGECDLQNLREMRFQSDEREAYGLQYGDIVMCEGGEPGRCAIWTEPVPNMMIQKAIHRIRARPEVPFRFLYEALRQRGQSGQMAALFTGSTIKHLPREKLGILIIEVPTYGLMTLFSAMVEPMARHIEVLAKRNLLLRTTRDLLLPKLISGRVDVEDLDIDIGESLAETEAS